ncbi:MAG: hypothetical protein JNJ55_06845 [Betaproteobacteria bacterium]|nr:hypothetical protein [Betaproteobacteria bacterium]
MRTVRATQRHTPAPAFAAVTACGSAAAWPVAVDIGSNGTNARNKLAVRDSEVQLTLDNHVYGTAPAGRATTEFRFAHPVAV